jgi:DNA-binding LacI/PurR family transcriptional regulator
LGLPLRADYVFAGDYTYESGRRAAQQLAALPESDRPTAVMASNDLMAIGCLVALKELGLRVPDDLSVMGIDDVATAQFVDPPLTTIALPLHDLGAAGMESLSACAKKLTATSRSPHQLGSASRPRLAAPPST